MPWNLNDAINSFFIILIGILAILTIKDLTYYNTVLIDLDSETITIKPSIVLFFLKHENIDIRNVRNFEVNTRRWGPHFQRPEVNLILKDSSVVKLISVPYEEIAYKISAELSFLL